MKDLYIKTPLVESLELSRICNSQVYLKMEAFQPSGSFKNRGIGFLCYDYAKNRKAKCFVSSSGGNAGLAVAYSGRVLGVAASVVVPRSTPQMMIDKIRREGAQVTVHGDDWNSADMLARQLSMEPDHYYIPPFDHPQIWKGHASLVYEIEETGLKPDAIVLAVGGGGLLCGVVQGLMDVGWHDVPVFTAETEGAASFALSVKEGKLVTLRAIETIATSLGAKTVSQRAFELNAIHPIVPHIVSDKQAVEACVKFADQHRILVEPACGASLSLIYDKLIDADRYQKIVVVVCGGSGVTVDLMQNWIQKTGIST